MLTPAASCASLVMDRINQITECSICVDTFDDPRVLPCVHTYCLRCLERTAERSNLGPGQTMSCPLCRDEFTIPDAGLAAGLRRNFFMANLIEMSAISNPSSDAAKPCELCLENQGEEEKDGGGATTDTAAIPGATTFCVECRQALCDQCTREHRRQRLSRAHRILKLGTPLTDDVAKEFGPNVCEHHPGKTTELYCISCRCVVCMLCYAETHNSHQCSNVIKTADAFRAQLGEDVDTVTDCLDQLVDMKTTMDEDRTRFIRELEGCRLNVVKRSAELRETLERHTKSLLDELASLQAIGLEEYGKESEELDRFLVTLKTFKCYCEEMRSKGTPSDVCRSIDDLRKRTDDLKGMQAVRAGRPICSLNVTFRRTENEDYVNSHPNMVGEIKGTAMQIRNKVVATCNRAVNSRLTGRIDIADRNITGVAFLCHRLYVVLLDGIRVFEDSDPFRPVTEITVPGMKSLVDAASCQTHQCLYVTDRAKSCIWKLTGDQHQASVLLQGIGNPYTVSVSSGDGNLVTVRWGQPSHIEIYRPDAVLLKVLKLDPQIVLPYHAVQTSTGNIVLSHGGKDNKTHRILEVSFAGQVLRSFPGGGGGGGDNPTRHLNCPQHLALDEEERVFVADFYNGVVLYLRRELDLDRVLAIEEKDGVRRPTRLCYVPGRNMLCVVNGNKFVDVYAIDRTDPNALFQDLMEEVTKKSLGPVLTTLTYV